MSTAIPNRRRVVLLVENDPLQREPYANALKNCGYAVVPVATAAEALVQAREQWVHLAVIDARLVNDNDPQDQSGINLALDELLAVEARVLYTGFEEKVAYSTVRQYNGGLPPNLRIRSKEDTVIDQMVEAAFRLKRHNGMGLVGINFDQVLKYEQPLSRLALPGLLKQPPSDDETALIWAKELEDLFGKAFPDDDVLKIAQLPQAMGFVLIVIPEREGVPRGPFIVKCGSRKAILSEYRLYEQHVYPFHAQFVGQIVGEPTQTLNFGLLTYIIHDSHLRNMRTFAEFYRQNTTEKIQQAVMHLLGEAERAWYRYGQQAIQSLFTFYQERLLDRSADDDLDWPTRWKDLRQAVDVTIRSVKVFEGLSIDVQGRSLHWTVDGLHFQLPDPHTFLIDVRDGRRLAKLFPKGYAARRCHGDLHAGNILVDDKANAWLIDFEHAGWGPPLQDPVELESSIHFGLINERDLTRLLRFEHLLAQQVKLSDAPTLPSDFRLQGPEDADLRRAYEVIMTLREATNMIEVARLKDYLLGLIFQALRVIQSDHSPRLVDPQRLTFHKVQALFLASVCCQRLDDFDTPKEVTITV